MTNREQCGRSSTRNYLSAAFPDGYLDTGNVTALESLDAVLRAALTRVNTQARVYDKEATAYMKNGETVPLRTEPVMLHRWKGICHGQVPLLTEGQRNFDTVGLKIIIRGRGRIQDMIRAILEEKPDAGSTQECETYTFGCQNVGVENWQ